MSAKLRTSLGIKDPDDFYARLIDLHGELTQEQSNKINAKIILMLANHVGEADVLDEILTYIKDDLGKN